MHLKFLLLINIALLILSGCTAAKHGYERRAYQSMGWLKVEKEGNDLVKKSGYKRLLNEMDFSMAVSIHVNNYGLPDYLMIPGYNRLHLAYFDEGLIYEFETSPTGKLLSKRSYKQHELLPIKIVYKFEEKNNNYIPVEKYENKPIIQALLPPKKNTAILNQRRLALVIGNSQYTQSPLVNPKNDALDIAKALSLTGFNVTLKLDVNHKEMEEVIAEFTSNLNQDSVGLFYYAGHAIQLKGDNYLIPVDANIYNQTDVRYKAVNLGQLIDGMGSARNGLNIVMLDACRDNPLPQSFRSTGNRGLSRIINSPDGTLVSFATSPGRIASDGHGRNGLYTKYLLKYIKEKHLSIEEMLKQVARGVKKESQNEQTPWMESSFTGYFSF
jgi:hypothetical protein